MCILDITNKTFFELYKDNFIIINRNRAKFHFGSLGLIRQKFKSDNISQ